MKLFWMTAYEFKVLFSMSKLRKMTRVFNQIIIIAASQNFTTLVYYLEA